MRPAGHDGRPAHAWALRRDGGDRPVCAAVIAGLPAGAYSVWLDDSTQAGELRIHGGRVTEWVAGGSATPSPQTLPELHGRHV